MSFFPERESVDPSGYADALSESLANKYGSWNAQVGTISLDGTKVECRNWSIKLTGSIAYPLVQASFNFSSPVDMTYFERLQFDISGVRHIKQGYIFIFDDKENNANCVFGFTDDGQWNRRIFTKDMFTLSETNPPFDWTKITAWLFLVPGTSPDVWIDAGPFTYTRFYKLTIASSPEGKHVLVDSIEVVTPNTSQYTPATYILKAEPTDFVKWEDGTITIERTITLNKDMTVTAYYLGEPKPQNLLPLLIGGATTIALFYALYKYL